MEIIFKAICILSIAWFVIMTLRILFLNKQDAKKAKK